MNFWMILKFNDNLDSDYENLKLKYVSLSKNFDLNFA